MQDLFSGCSKLIVFFVQISETGIFKFLHQPQILRFGDFNDLLLLLSIETLGSTIFLQEFKAVFLVLIKCHDGELLATALHYKFPSTNGLWTRE
jgi:hypothetical protein